MNNRFRRPALSALLLTCCLALSQCASRVNFDKLATDSRAALNDLYANNPKARNLGASAQRIVVFPVVARAGFMFGGMGGNGAAIRSDGSIRDFYQTGGASYGLQAGVQTFGYALFLMDDLAVHNLDRSGGWEIGSVPTLVVWDRGISRSLSTTTLRKNIHAIFFNQRGLMGGLGFQGSKITRLHPPQGYQPQGYPGYPPQGYPPSPQYPTTGIR